MGLIREAWQKAVRRGLGRATDRKLEELKQDGVDECKLCGHEVPVHADDEWSDIQDRLLEHAVDSDDHIRDPQLGWVLADGSD